MKPVRSPKMSHKLILPFLLLMMSTLIVVSAYFPGTTAARSGDDADAVSTAWQRANEIGAYRYTTEIEQTTWPLAKLENVGLGSTTEHLYIEGDIDTKTDTLVMKVWSGGGNTLTDNNALEIHVADGKTTGRVGNSAWREVDDFTDLFAPGRDPLAYLAGAEDIHKIGSETRAGITFDRYAFRLDGPSFAIYMRDQMERELVRKGELPTNMHLDMARVYVDMQGDGEIWLDSNGLPLRQTLHVDFPPDQSERAELQITTDFSDFQVESLHAAVGQPTNGILAHGTKLNTLLPRNLVQTAANFCLFGLCTVLIALLLLYQKSKRVYAATTILVTLAMLITPLLQSQQAYAFSQKQAAARAQDEQKREASEQSREWQTSLYAEKSFDPQRDPLAHEPSMQSADALSEEIAKSALLDVQQTDSTLAMVGSATTECDLEADTGTDSDEDNLTDMQETCIGTDPGEPDSDNDGLGDAIEVFELGTNPTAEDGEDSDGDGILDGAEVVGFEDSAGKRWHLNPLDADSNGDGIADGIEVPIKKNGKLDCTDTDSDGVPNCQADTDGDATPDAFDFDDDNDGVPDRVDLARTLAAGTVSNGAIDGLDNRVLRFKMDDLALDTPVYVDFQLRPTNPDHLWYTLNVLDWPGNDREGQVQRVHNTTFGTSGKEANGDMRLIPMLEIEIPYEQGHYGHLPTLPGAPAISPSTPITVWLDTDELATFNITVRKKNDAGDLVAYVPLVLTNDPAGDSPVAFSGRMFYRPSIDAVGAQQKARLVWVIQAKTDYCTPVPDDFQPDDAPGDRYEAWCAGKTNWVEAESVIHTYYDDWYLTGMSIREDHGLEAGIVFENPDYAITQDYDPDTYYEAYLWALAANLDETFIAGRGEDTDGDGEPDIRNLTLDDIWTRFHTGSTASETERWDIPNDALQVITYTFPHQSYISYIPMTHTQEVLDGYFMDGITAKIANPTLLFVREETARTVALDDGDAVMQHSATIENGCLPTNQLKIVLDPDEVPETVLAAMNWAPYQHTQAGGWEADAIDEYLVKVKARLRPEFENDSFFHPDDYSPEDIADIIDAAEIVAGSFYLTLFTGLNNIVEMTGFPLPLAYARKDIEVSYTIAKAGGSVARVIVQEISYQAAESGIWASLGRRIMDAKWFTKLFGSGGTNETLYLLKATGQESNGATGTLAKVWKSGGAGKALIIGGAVIAVSLALYVGIALALDLPGTEFVIQGISLGISLLVAGLAIKTFVTAARATTDGIKMVIRLANTTTKAAAIAAVIGMVITAVIAIGFFVYNMVSGGVRAGSLAFDQALANVIATIIVAAIMLAIGMIPVIGPLIVAIIGAIDALIVTACMIVEATTDVENEGWWTLVKNYGCGGISGAMTKLVETFIYDQTPLVDLQAPDRMTPTNFQIDISPLAEGMAVNGQLSISADVITALYRNAPLEPDRWEREIDALVEDGDFEALQRLMDDFGVGIFYIWQFADPFINDATFRYSLVTTDTQTIDVSIKQMESEWQPASDSLLDSKRYTITQHVDNGGNITFIEPGLNWEPELYLAESYAIQAQECTVIPPGVPPNVTPIPIPVCWLRPTEDDLHIPLGESFKFDVFPATLDGFYALSSMGDKSYALAWDSRFPTLADADGDGLRSQAKGGNDPDDRFPDTDLDGLSDFYEIQQGLDPTNPDIDGDGWNDYEEILHDTNPTRADSDSDGLPDKAEVEGWEYIYDFDDNNNALITRVTSDPNDPDTDGDGITDRLEQVYGFNPRVYSEPNILSLTSQPIIPECVQINITSVQVLAMSDEWPGTSDGELGILLDGQEIWRQEGVEMNDSYTPDVFLELCGNATPLQMLEYDSLSNDDDLGTLSLDSSAAGTFSYVFTDGSGVAIQLDWTITSAAQSTRFIAPGQTLAYTATVESHLRDRYALGLLETDFAVAIPSSDTEPQVYKLPPGSETTLDGYLTVQSDIAQSQQISLTHRAGASLTDLRGEASGRVLWLRFNENAGATRFVDNSLLGYDGTCSGSTCPDAGQTGYAGQAVDFDGTDDYVSVGTGPAIIGKAPFSVGAWVKTSSATGQVIIQQRGSDGFNGEYQLRIKSDGNVYWWSYGDGQFGFQATSSGVLVNDGNWHHIAGVREGDGTGRIYIDGVERGVDSGQPARTLKAFNIYIGADMRDSTRYFDGLIDDVEILPVALSPAEVATRVRAPVFHAKFDESAYDCPQEEDGDCLLSDSSSSQNAISCPQVCTDIFGTIICDNARCPTLSQNSRLGTSIGLNQKQHLHVGPSDNLDLSQGAGDFTLSVWLRPQAYTEYIAPANKDGYATWEGWYAAFGGDNYPTLYVDETGTNLGARLKTTDGSCYFQTTGAVLNTGTWQHVMVTYGDDLFTLYINGEAVDPSAYTQAACSGVTLQSATAFDIGRRNENGYVYFEKVWIDDEGDGSGLAEHLLTFDNDDVWYRDDIDDNKGNGLRFDIQKKRSFSDDDGHNIRYCENDDGDQTTCLDDDQGTYDDSILVSKNIQNTSLGNYEMSYGHTDLGEPDTDGAGILYFQVDNDFYRGRLDDLRIYRYAFTADEALALYQGTERALEIRFDESPGRDVFYDYSGAGFNGTCDFSDGTCPDSGIPGRANQAARFDGVDDYVQTTFENDLPVDDFTMAVWFKTSSAQNQKILYSSSNDRPLVLNNGLLRTCILDQCATGTTRVDDGQWHFVALVGNGSAVQLYLDGNTTPEATLAVTSGTMSGQLRIGQDSSGSNFEGLLDHIVVIRKALDTAGIAEVMAEAPIVSLHLDDPAESITFSDTANPSVSGSCVITPTQDSDCGCPASGIDGWMRRGVFFEGLHYTDQIRQCIAVDSDIAPDSFTVGGWFKPTRKRGDAQTLVYKEGAFDLYIRQNTMNVQFSIPQITRAGVTAPQDDPATAQDVLILNQWNHVMVTYNKISAGNNQLDIYINGSKAFSGTQSWEPESTSVPIQIGRNFAGMADEVVVYNKALSENDIADIYNYQVTWYDTTYSHDITIDADKPGVRLDFPGTHIPVQAGLVMAAVATDTTSLVELVEYRVGDGTWQEAERDRNVWAFAITPTIAGPLTLRVRATDSAGNRAQSSKTLTVDNTGPTVTLDTVLTTNVQDAATHLLLTGTATDDASGVDRVVVSLYDAAGRLAGGPWMASATTVPADGWLVDQTLNLPLNGQYTVHLEATDKVGNSTTSELARSFVAQTPVIQLDGIAPFADITDVGARSYALAGNPTITGTLSEIPYPTGQILHLHFEETAGATELHDGSLYRSTGTCTGGTCLTAGESGYLGNAAHFDGTDQINLGQNLRLGALTEDFSVLAWVNLASTGGVQHIIAADTVSSTNGFGFSLNTGRLQLESYDIHTYATTTPTLNTGQWTHVAAVVARTATDEIAVTFYVDGLPRQSLTHTLPGLRDEDDVWRIGLGLDGLLDELVLYNRALTPAQVLAIAQPGISGIAGGDVGLLHVKDRDTLPEPASYAPISLTQTGQAFTAWNYAIEPGIEGPHEIHLRATDALSHTRVQPNVWQGEIDTQAPRATLTHIAPRFPGDWDIYRCWAEDYNLVDTDYACPVPHSQPEYQDAEWYTEMFSQTKLYRYVSPVIPVSDADAGDILRACDAFSACTTVTRTTQTVAWPLGVAILTPTTHSAFTSLDPIEISGAAYASNTLDSLAVTANITTVYTQTGIAAQTLAWTAAPAWIPPGEGTYTLVATVQDQNTNIITSGAPISGDLGLSTVIYVDTTAPELAITTDRVNSQNFDSNGYIQVTGLVTETTGILRLQARLQTSAGSAQEDAWQAASHSEAYPLAGATWSATLYSGSPIPPSGQPYMLTARVTDVANHTVEVSRVVWADAVPPAAFDLSLTYTDSQGLRQSALPGAVIDDAQDYSPTLTVTWTASSDDGGLGPYQAAWIEQQPAASPVLQSTDIITPRIDTFGAGEAQKLTVQITAYDLYDNETVQKLDPIYVDGEETPAYIGTDASGQLALPPYRGWLQTRCNLLGADTRAEDADAQNLYATWNADGLRITWTGAHWGNPGNSNGEGDLFIYLDMASGGAVDAYNPYTTTGNQVLLPAYRVQDTMQRMAADHLLWIEGSDTARLMTWNAIDSEWQSSTSVWDYVFDGNLTTPHTDIYLPFDALGITNPVSASLALVAFATEEGTLAPWAIMPSDNPVYTEGDLVLTHRYSWASLGSGMCPKNGRFAGPYVEVSLEAEPAGIGYSILGNALPEATADELAALIGWDVLDKEPCLSHPETLTCTWLIDNASKVAFESQIALAHELNVDVPALGDGQQVTYTLRFANEGSAQATNVIAHVATWGHLHLPGDTLQTPPVTLNVGEQHVQTFTAKIDTSYDPTHDTGWGTLDVVVFDDTSIYTAPHSYEYPVEWLYVDHEIDQEGPEYVEIQSPPGIIKPQLNTIGGFAYDQSPVPTVTLEVKAPASTVTTFVCPDAAPEDTQWTCAVDVGAAQEGAQFEIRAMATDMYGQSSAWSSWKTFIVDSTPPSVTLSSKTQAALSDGWISASESTFKGKAYDDYLVSDVEVCDPETNTCETGTTTLDSASSAVATYEYDQQPTTPLTIETCASPVSVPITVTENFTVADVDVGLNLNHPQRSDLKVTLYAPSGVSVTLIQAGTDVSNYDVLLDDTATLPLWKDAVKHTTSAPYYENTRRPDRLLSHFQGEAAQGTWQLVMCDTSSANTGTYNQGRLILTADTLPISTTATWKYALPPITADGVAQSRTVYGIDSVGNRSTVPLSLTYQLDNVPPVITVRDNLVATDIFTVSGTVSDGGEVSVVGILILLPNGTFFSTPIELDGDTWAYAHQFTQEGTYVVWIAATDKAGNQSTVGPFVPGEEVFWRVYLPLVVRGG